MSQQATESAMIQQVRYNYIQILAMLTGFGPSLKPTPQQVANFFAGLNTLNAGLPVYQQIQGPGQSSHTIGDETYNWTEYQSFIVDAIDKLRRSQQEADGPFMLPQLYRPCY